MGKKEKKERKGERGKGREEGWKDGKKEERKEGKLARFCFVFALLLISNFENPPFLPPQIPYKQEVITTQTSGVAPPAS